MALHWGQTSCHAILRHGKVLIGQNFRLSCRLPGRDRQGTIAPHGQGHPHDRQQELRLLVAARLAAVQVGRARLRRGMAVASDDPSTRAELLLLSPSFLVPCLTHDGIKVWDTLAIAEYLNEILPEAGLLPKDRAARAHCRSISGEMHSGFSNMRSALPMNLKAHHPGFKVWAGAQADIDRIVSDLARMPRATTAARSCSATSRAWPTRCSRRCARASSPTTSSSTAPAPPIARRSWRCRTMQEWIEARQDRARRIGRARRRVLVGQFPRMT